MAWLGFGPEDAGEARMDQPKPDRPGSRTERGADVSEVPADVAEQRAIDEIMALEEDLERAQEEARTRIAELERQAAEAEERLAAELRMREELARSKAEIEAELATARRQLDEALERAVAAERRTAGIEAERRGEPETVAVEPQTIPDDPEPLLEHETQPVAEAEFEENAEPPGPGAVRLSDASFDELRSLGMSVTQAKRVIDYRERLGGFGSIDALDSVPGFPKAFLAQVKSRLTL
jgi:DNA uptake protein ComE-like DNA-binding protein